MFVHVGFHEHLIVPITDEVFRSNESLARLSARVDIHASPTDWGKLFVRRTLGWRVGHLGQVVVVPDDTLNVVTDLVRPPFSHENISFLLSLVARFKHHDILH